MTEKNAKTERWLVYRNRLRGTPPYAYARDDSKLGIHVERMWMEAYGKPIYAIRIRKKCA